MKCHDKGANVLTYIHTYIHTYEFLVGIISVEFKFAVIYYNEKIVKFLNYLQKFCNDVWVCNRNNKSNITLAVHYLFVEVIISKHGFIGLGNT